MADSLNVISFFHGSNIREAARKPIVTYSMHGSQQVPCTMDIVDRFEQTEKALDERFQATLSATGPGARSEFEIVADQTLDQIDSPEKTKVGHGAHTSDTMAQFIVDHWKEDAYNMIHVRAHGHAHEDVMGMPTQEFLAALDKASQRVGRPIETVLLESCLMGNLEVLSQMGGSVSTVLASQEVLNAKALPHVEMFSAALDSDMQPRSVASRMMNAISEHGTPDTMIALEPSKLGAVTESVKALKERIESKGTSDRAFRKSAKRAVRASSPFPRRNVQTDLRRKLDLRDLGEISQSLAAAEFGPDVGQAARAVSKTSAEAVIQIVRGPGYEDSSGLSVRTESVTKKPRFNFFGLR